MKTKTIEHDFAPYQTGRLTTKDYLVLEALAEAGYQLSVARLTNERSGFYWKSRLAILRSKAA